MPLAFSWKIYKHIYFLVVVVVVVCREFSVFRWRFNMCFHYDLAFRIMDYKTHRKKNYDNKQRVYTHITSHHKYPWYRTWIWMDYHTYSHTRTFRNSDIFTQFFSRFFWWMHKNSTYSSRYIPGNVEKKIPFLDEVFPFEGDNESLLNRYVIKEFYDNSTLSRVLT